MTHFTDENMGNSVLTIHVTLIYNLISHIAHVASWNTSAYESKIYMSRKTGHNNLMLLGLCSRPPDLWASKNAVGIFNGNWCLTIVAFCALYTFMCRISPLDHSQRNSEKANGPSLVYPVDLYNNCKQTTKCWSDPQEWEISLSASNAICYSFIIHALKRIHCNKH